MLNKAILLTYSLV